MQERKSHESLVPRWVVKFATMMCPFGRWALPARHNPWGKAATYFSLFFLTLVGVGMFVGFPVVLLDQYGIVKFESWPVSGYWFLLLPVLVPLRTFIMRSLAFHWINRTWKRITGEKDLERYLCASTTTAARAEETLTRVARRVRFEGFDVKEFHLARDIAALHMLCEPTLRMRHLVRE